jgi:hypothetical protein
MELSIFTSFSLLTATACRRRLAASQPFGQREPYAFAARHCHELGALAAFRSIESGAPLGPAICCDVQESALSAFDSIADIQSDLRTRDDQRTNRPSNPPITVPIAAHVAKPNIANAQK